MKNFFEPGITSLLLRNLFFTVLQPGLVVGLFPFFILKRESPVLFNGHFGLVQFLGTFLFLVGAAVLFDSIIRFAFQGRGTLSPADPTKKLVVTGLYKYSRNPMYWGIMLILMGEALFFESGGLWIYLLVVFVVFTLFIMLVEEPRLRKDFGNEYEEYRKRVRRWI